MELVPAEFPCPAHQIDLTDLVREELGDDGFRMSYEHPLGRPRRRPFEVQVTCPGNQPDAAHPLVFKGTFR